MLLNHSGVRPKILVIATYYLPGYRAGGPVRSVAGIIEALSSRFDFYVVTLNHDFDTTTPYPGIKENGWNRVASSNVYYATDLGLGRLRALVNEIKPDVLYLNSVFASTTGKVLLGLRLGLFPAIPVVIAPRGEFAATALALKAYKKKPYVSFMRALGLYQRVTWHASANHEIDDIARMTASRHIVMAPQVSALQGQPNGNGASERPRKEPGFARFVFVSRISRMKNLPFLLDVLSKLTAHAELTICGPAEDRAVWNECEAKIAAMPTNVRVSYRGEVDHADVPKVLSANHFLTLPTLGENFGHIIAEAFHCGVPVIISDRTPWRGLQQAHAGLDLPLDVPSWQNALQWAIDLDEAEYAKLMQGALAYAATISSSENIEKQANVFYSALARS